MKLKSKLVLGNMLMVILTMGCLSFSQWMISSYFGEKIVAETSDNMSESFSDHARDKAEQTINYLSDALLNPMYFYDIETIQSLLEPALKDTSTIAIKVFDTKGVVIHTGSDLVNDYGMALQMPALEEAVLRQRRAYFENDIDTLAIARPLTLNNELLGGVVLEYSLKSMQEDIQDNKTIIKEINQLSNQYSTLLIALVTVIMCLISLLLSMLMANTIIGPITQLVHHSKRIKKGQYQTPNRIQRDDELGLLAKSFNEMDASLKERSDAIEFLAYNDPLTKLPNRMQFIDFLERKLESSNPDYNQFAVFFIDLDEFKRVNDNLGHQAGDDLLCEVASRISDSVRKTSEIEKQKVTNLLARVGGDEFILYVSGIHDLSLAHKFAADVISELKKPIFLPEPSESVVVGASIGIALYPESGATSEELVRNADIAMYAAKSCGKGSYRHFTQEMEQQVINKGQIERDLRSALSDFSQFELYYQPKIDLKTAQIVGVEALIRWNHPSKGSILPGEFIPVAEATDIIHPLGDWVIEQACRDLSVWRDFLSPSEFHVALNLSAKQLYAQKISDTVSLYLKEYRLPSSYMHVEVTETALMVDKKSAKETLDTLRAIGIEVWLDDFGTGYSSLGYLREFSIDGVKIDRSFISDIQDDANDRALCAAIISMAHQLGIKTVAEGIETHQQSTFLTQESCDFGQGYLYGKPMPAEKLTQKLQLNHQQKADNIIRISVK